MIDDTHGTDDRQGTGTGPTPRGADGTAGADDTRGADCRRFRERIYRFQADELSERERRDCQDHLDACPRCARRLEMENALLAVLRAKLPRTPAPPGLETRIRAALRREDPVPAAVGWYRTGWLAASAAALLLVVLLVLGFSGGLRPSGTKPLHVVRQVTIVDLDCDRAGVSIQEQRRCTHPLHLNALKLADGRYWTISPDQEEYRSLLLDRDQRGRRVIVEGELYPALKTLYIERVEPPGRASL